MVAGLEILNLHAQGGMAEVYRARATDVTGQVWYYAVKRILPELLKDPEMMRMFVEEQRIAACLVHDNIVRVYDVAHARTGDASGADTFIVMEFLEGKDLAEIIDEAKAQGRTLPVWLVLHMAREVLKALHYASTEARDKSGRALGLIHRDISPHNIFICTDGQVKLTDFGVARVENTDVRTRAGVIKGKFGYMSPEQLAGGPLDPRSDLYNVGILIYEALTGQRLFFGETATQFIAAMLQNEVPPLDKRLLVPPELDKLMRMALSRNRDERPRTALAFEGQLAAIARQYGLDCQRGHVAQELAGLFPELVANASTTPSRLDELAVPPPRTEPEQAPATPVAAPVADAWLEVSEDVFTTTLAPSRLAARDEASQAAKKPPPSRVPTKDVRVSPPPPVADEGELLATVLEERPDLEALGLTPADFAIPIDLDDDDAPRTELRRVAFKPSDPISATSPADPKGNARSGAPAVQDELEAETAELARPAVPSSPPAPPLRPGRVLTGSRKVVRLEAEATLDDASLPRRRP
jgi:serine/threonine protein kinase